MNLIKPIDHIETQIYSLAFTAGQAPEAVAYVGVSFQVKKILFKPVNCYFTTENAAGGYAFNPFLVYCDLLQHKPVGYSGHISNAVGAGGVAGSAGQWIAVNNDITFTLTSPLNLINIPITFALGSSLNGGNRFATCPFTGVVTVTVEYHSEY